MGTSECPACGAAFERNTKEDPLEAENRKKGRLEAVLDVLGADPNPQFPSIVGQGVMAYDLSGVYSGALCHAAGRDVLRGSGVVGGSWLVVMLLGVFGGGFVYPRRRVEGLLGRGGPRAVNWLIASGYLDVSVGPYGPGRGLRRGERLSLTPRAWDLIERFNVRFEELANGDIDVWLSRAIGYTSKRIRAIEHPESHFLG